MNVLNDTHAVSEALTRGSAVVTNMHLSAACCKRLVPHATGAEVRKSGGIGAGVRGEAGGDAKGEVERGGALRGRRAGGPDRGPHPDRHLHPAGAVPVRPREIMILSQNSTLHQAQEVPIGASPSCQHIELAQEHRQCQCPVCSALTG